MLLDFLRKKEVTLAKRSFEPQYLRSEAHFSFYKENGYCIYRNIIPPSIVEQMLEVYRKMCAMEGFTMGELFVNSGRFESNEIRTLAINEIKKTSGEILENIVIPENCAYKNGGSYQIKPASKTSQLNPHQDTPIVDELNFYSIYAWIPLCDVNQQNGTLSVLPKSHLWGNYQRSLNVPWIYEKYTNKLWKHMQPLNINKGDLICFDSALIHASGPNLSNEVRVAYNTAILPKDFQQVHYYMDKDTPQGMVEEYLIDETFYMDENILQKPPARFPKNALQHWEGAKGVSSSTMNSLLSASLK
ncbi:MAG: phytanoyl-CoA dioxygenase family protein [Chitinophagales bacterium]|nr:phytanoyl-CoA dioxygenase family protein [Chitinophagales bacterium]